jgi:hypothetical protein
MKTLFILFSSLYISFALNATCLPKKLIKGELKQTYSTYYGQDSLYSSILELDTSLFKYTKLIFNKASDFDTLTLKFYTLDPCNASNEPMSEFKTVQNEIIINYKEDYKYIKVISSGTSIQTFTISTLVLQVPNTCNEFSNKYNRFNNPILADPLQTGNNAMMLCNINCRGLNIENKLLYQNIDDPIVWIQYPITEQTILNIEWNNPNYSLLIYGVKAGKSFFVRDLFFSDVSTQSPLYLQFSDYDAIKIGAYCNEKNISTLNLSLKKLANKQTCVNYFDVGHILSPIYTSKNSPLEGPYQYGENVTFEYKLIDWLPINNNWFHGIHVIHGNGWKGFKKDSLNRLLVRLPEKFILHDSFPYNNVVQLYQKDSIRVAGFNVKNLLLPGFYFKSAFRGPSGPTSNFNWGQDLKAVRGSKEFPLFSLKFTLQADSLKDCLPLNGDVSVLPVSDHQTGIYEIQGCVETIPIYKPASIKCCEVVYANSFMDTTMCSGEEFLFTNLTSSAAEYQILSSSQNQEYSFEKVSYNNNLKLINETQVIDTLTIKVTWGEGSTCLDSKEFKIFVKPQFSESQITFDNICKNQMVNLSEALTSKIDKTAYVKDLTIHQFTTITDENEDIWIGSEDTKDLGLTISSHCFCDNTIALKYNPGDCDALGTNNNSTELQVKLQPNPTYETTDIIIENNTNSTEWTLNIYDANGQLIKSSLESFPQGSLITLHYNLEKFTPGEYYFNLTDFHKSISKKLIKLKN